MDSIIWFLLLLVSLGVHLLEPYLIAIWFACGCVPAMVLSGFTGQGWFSVQFVLFSGTVVLLLYFVRPKALKSRVYSEKKRLQITNFNRIVGMTGQVTSTIDSIHNTGRVLVDGKDWMARAETPDLCIGVGELVEVLAIEQVCLVVKPLIKDS